jgi:hypothetical protein
MTKDELTKKTVKELLVIARRKGLRGVSRLRKAQLIATLLAAMSAPLSPHPPQARRRVSVRTSRVAATGSGQQTRKQLLALAKQQGLTGVSRLRKAQLLARLVGAPFSAPPVAPPPLHIPPLPAALPPVAAPHPTTPHITVPATPHPSPVQTHLQEPPSGQQENRVVLLARDPYQLYAYWDLPADQTRIGQSAWEEGQLVVRVITVAAHGAPNGREVITFTLPATATESYISALQPATSYRADICYRSADGRCTVLGRSNIATTPRATLSASTTVQWFTPPGYAPSLPSTTYTHLLPSTLSREPGSWYPGHDVPGLPSLPAPLVLPVPRS